MLATLLFITQAETTTECPAPKGQPSIGDLVYKMGTPSRGFGKILIPDATNELPTDVMEGDQLTNYIVGSVGFGVPFFIYFVILLIYFISITICTCCPCCHAKQSFKPTCCQTIMFMIFGALFAVSGVFVSISTGNLISTLSEIGEVPGLVINTFGTIKEIANGTVPIIKTYANDFIENIGTTFNKLIEDIDAATENEQAAEDVKTKAEDVKTGFTDYGTKATFFDTSYEDINTDCAGEGTESLQKLYDNVKFVKTPGNLGYFIKAPTVMGELNGELGDIKTQVEGYKENTLSGLTDKVNEITEENIQPQIDSVIDMLPDINTMVEPVTSIIDTVKPLGTTISLVIAIISIAIALVYIIFFFCNNCCSRCFFTCFGPIGLILSIIIILIAVLFSVLFIPLYEICPSLETVVDPLINDMLPLEEPVSLTDIAMCKGEEKSLIKLTNVDKLIGIDGIFDSAKNNLQSYVKDINLGDYQTKMDELKPINPDESLTMEALFEEDPNALFEAYEARFTTLGTNPPQIAECTTTLGNADMTAVRGNYDAAKSSFTTAYPTLEPLNASAKTLWSYVSELDKNVQFATDTFERSPDLFVNGLKDGVYTQLDKLDCSLVCSVYVPVKDALCYTLVNAMAFWILGSVIFIPSVVIFSCLIMKRRKSMQTPGKVGQPEDEFNLEDINY